MLAPSRSVAVAVICKTPMAGKSKTRLSPPLSPQDCAALSTCFIRDIASTIQSLVAEGGVVGYAVYTPAGSEDAILRLLPAGFRLLLQGPGDLGDRLRQANNDLLALGHAGVILVNSDSPTLPADILRDAVAAVRQNDCVVLGPAIDGGYTLVGLSQPHDRIFSDIPWSTSAVYDLSVERAQEIDRPVVTLPYWYDVDDASTLSILQMELAGQTPDFALPGLVGAPAPATRAFLAERAQTERLSAGV